jgi:hypothetical protein
MRKYVKPILWITGAVASFFGLLLVLLLLAPVLINMEPVKQRVFAEFSRATGGAIETRRIDLSFFPRPSITLRGGRISIPEKVSGTFSSLSIYPEVRPLLNGRIRFSAVTLESPDIQTSLPDDLEKLEGMGQLSLKAIDEGLASIAAKIAPHGPSLVLSIEKGSLTLLRRNKSAFWFRDIHTRVSLSGKRLGVEVECNANIWKHASLAGWIRPGDFQCEGHLQLAQLRPDLIVQTLFPSLEPRIEDSQVNLTLGFGADGVKSSNIEFESDAPRTTLRKGQETITLDRVNLKGTLSQSGDRTAASITELSSVYPRLTMSGSLNIDPVSSRAGVELRAKGVDVESVRRTGLFLAGQLSFVQSIFEILKKGRVPEMSLTARGKTIADLAKKENIVIRGSIIGGNILIAKPRLDIEDVKGDAVIAGGVIEGRNLEARLGTAIGTKGLLRVDLKGEPEPLHLDIHIDTDVAKLPLFLRDVVEDEAFLRELDLVKDLRGDASGRLVLDRATSGTQVTVDVKAFSLHAFYQKFPYPLEVRGKFLYDQPTARIAVEDISGKAGRGAFSQLSGQLSLAKEPYLETTSGAATIVLDEIYPWLLSFDSMKDVLEKVGSAKGVVKLDALELKGPLSLPSSWQFRVGGRVENVTVSSQLLPTPLELASGNFEAGPKRLVLSRMDTRFLDSSLTVSGVLNNYLEEFDSADLSIEGQIGAQSTLRISDLLKPPREIRTLSPFSLSQAHLHWEKSGKVSLSGNVGLKNGPDVFVDALSDHGDLVIKRLVIKDAGSDASLSFHLKGRVLDLTFKGTLTGATLDELLEKNEFLTGWIKGNLSTHIALDKPSESVAQGTLEGAGLKFPLASESPLHIDTFSLKAQNSLFTVDSNLLFSGHDMRIKGKVDFLSDGFVFDADLFMNGFDVDDVVTMVLSQEGGGAFLDLPVKGTVRLQSEYVRYDRFTWRPVHATIVVGSETTRIEITQADLCGIAAPGFLEISSTGLEFRAKPGAKDQDLRETVICLSDNKEINGRFSFDADVSGKGRAEALAGSLNGTMEFDAKKGRIFRYGFLGKIFEVLSPMGILTIPDLRKEGFSYNSIRVKGHLQESKLAIREALMDAPSTNLIFNGEIDLIAGKIDGVVLVVPFRILDRIISAIPLIGYIMAGRLVAIPVAVTGDLDNPTMTPLSPSAVGASLLDMAKRILRLPLKIIQPLLPKEEKTGSS